MSAEWNKCGADIVYPPGTWPLGTCARCDLAPSGPGTGGKIEKLKIAGNKLAERLRITCDSPDVGWGSADVSAIDEWEKASNESQFEMPELEEKEPGVNIFGRETHDG